MLSLDSSLELALLCFKGVHRLSRARVEDPLRDRLDEVRELNLHVRASGLQCPEDLVPRLSHV